MKLLYFLTIVVNVINGEPYNAVQRNTIMIDGLLQETLIEQKDAIAQLTNELTILKYNFVDYQKVWT